MVRTIPLSVIATWPPPNYVDPVRRGPGAVVVTIAFMVLASIAVFSRLFVHAFVVRSVGPGDFFIILAYLSTVAMTSLEIVGYEQYDWGRHIWDVPINNFSRSIYISWWYRIVYSAAACFTRMALLFFYYRLTEGGHTAKLFRRWIHLVALFSAAVGLALVLATIFQCAPIRAMWTYPPVPGARCINEGIWTFACGIVNTIADISVVVLPIPMIYKLQLPLRKRIGAILLVSLGFLVCVVAVVRTYFVWLSLVHSYDETWDGFGALVAATIEIHVGLMCACAPAIRLGVVKFIKPKLSSLRRTAPSAPLSPRTLYTKMSTIETSIDLKDQKESSWSNSGTFLDTQISEIFDSEKIRTTNSTYMAPDSWNVENTEQERGPWSRTKLYSLQTDSKQKSSIEVTSKFRRQNLDNEEEGSNYWSSEGRTPDVAVRQATINNIIRGTLGLGDPLQITTEKEK
ncbi:uncharacterized protein PV09_05251 [Verruconis gallopava]|uniref:Rhodopsin domain-containing protein n=1 Tax=Verruconis gallopava TaxID=253628 RepID=A0A0D2AWG7_9PEZI|nr:uncharacterized protein PV09_05251 [Verruconis gallopava]KIW03484.1 hypothetical protein PV09_05251 [Verruconis gallopava]